MLGRELEAGALGGEQEKFFTAISHELRTPLNGIIGLADGLINGSSGDLPT